MNADTPQGPCYDAIRAMSQRMDFSVGKDILTALTLPTSVGWKATVRTAGKAAESSVRSVELAEKLTTSFRDHTIYGEKLVLYYGFAGINRTDLAQHDLAMQKAGNMAVPYNEFQKAWPLSVHRQEALEELQDSPPSLTVIKRSGDRTYFLFSSVRSFNEQVELDPSSLSPSDREALAEYSQLIGIRPLRRQCFDWVIYDSARKLVELRLDSPEGMPKRQQQTSLQRVIAAFNSLRVFQDGWSPFDVAPYNFHELMKSLYNKRGEGTVFQLGFTASSDTSSSNNGARLIRRRNVDLRTDPFHVGGSKSVRDVSVYSIGVEWQREGWGARPRLIIPGTMKDLYESPVTFPELFVRGCINKEQFGFVKSKIEQYR